MIWLQSVPTNKRATRARRSRARCSFVAARSARAAANLLTLGFAACSANEAPPAYVFFDALQPLCGQTLTGRVVSQQAVDADWRAVPLTLGPIDCSNDAITIDMPQRLGDDVMVMPLAVGEDASRVWTLRTHAEGVEFRHFHYEPDGSPSAVTSYGGLNLPGGTAKRQSFPADDTTQANFTANGIARSNPNIWTLSLDRESGLLSYALARPAAGGEPARDFRAEFDVRGVLAGG